MGRLQLLSLEPGSLESDLCYCITHLDCILQMLVLVQDSGQGWFSPKIPAFSHGLLFLKMSRGKPVLAKQGVPAEVMVGQNWLKGYQN